MTTTTADPAAMSATFDEAARLTPVVHDCDLCVVGGSVTGVFAAVAAARLGLSVCVIEVGNQFGGNTTLGLVAVWHSLWNTTGDRQVIGGLTEEFVKRLKRRPLAVVETERTSPHWQFALNPAEAAIELDCLIREHRIRPFLHARVVACARDGGVIRGVIIEDKSGRRAIRAARFVDASGDADLVKLAGGATGVQDHLQPPTMAALVSGLAALRAADPKFWLAKTVFDPANPHALPPGFLWAFEPPSAADESLVFGTRVHGVDCSDADHLTAAEMEGRRQVRQMIDALRHGYPGKAVALSALPARIGVRETRHAVCAHRLTEDEVLSGELFPDAIAHSCYRVDIHKQGGEGLVFRYLDGREIICGAVGTRSEGRWRPPQAVDPTFYSIPYRALLPRGFANLVVAGRCLDADAGAFGAVRVQVTCNQMGEAAGTAAALSLQAGCAPAELDPQRLRACLCAHGARLAPEVQGAVASGR